MIRTAVGCVGVVGTGVIGSGWATRALARGLDVIATDPDPAAAERLFEGVERAWPAVRKLGLFPGADPDRLTFVNDIGALAARADLIQESAPESEELKRDLLAEIDALAPPDVLIASSSSGLLPSHIQRTCSHPERIVIGHPFNPVYLLPLVEVVAGEQTSDEAVEAALSIYRELGMHPLRLSSEIEGYLSDRLQEAMWREILHLVKDGIATTGELDEAITYGPGLRWASMGTNLTFHLAGGDGGMREMLEKFGPALYLPWTKMAAPELTTDLVDAMADGTETQAGGRTVAELERLRDDCLIAVMRALRPYDVGAGRIVAEREARIHAADAVSAWTDGVEVPAPLELSRCQVEPDWVDYNGHMTESAYLLAFGWASDALFRYIGIDEAYRNAGYSFYTAETHLGYRSEVAVGEPLRFETRVLDHDHKRLHIYHSMCHDQTGELLATTEQMLLHVETAAGRTAPLPPEQARAVAAVGAAHADLEQPPGVGRRIGIR